MNKSRLTRLWIVGGVGASAVGLVLFLLMWAAPPAQAQNPASFYPEIVANAALEQLGAVKTADTPATPARPADYPGCDLFVSDESGSDDSYSCSIDARCRSVQRAVEAIMTETKVICVSGGSYAWSEVEFRGEEGLVDIEKSVIVLGGWNYDFDTRDPVLYPSRLDAERQERVLYIAGPITVTIDGFEIISGYRSLEGGGGIYAEDAYITVANCLIAHNIISESMVIYGGGIRLNNTDGARITDSIFENNFSGGMGGGVYARYSDDLLLQNLTVVNNVAQSKGGGMYLPDCPTATLRSILVANNQAVTDQGGLYLDGDGPTLDHIVVDDNSAGSSYGGLYVNGHDATLNYVAVNDNTAVDSYGGFHVNGDNATLNHITVTNNIATGLYVGGGYVQGDHASLSNILVQNNSVDSSGDYGGLRVAGNDANLSHIVVSDNTTGDDYGGLYVAGIVVGSRTRLSYITVTNNIAYGQLLNRGAAGIYLDSDTVTLTHILVQNNAGFGEGTYANAGGLYLRDSDNSLLQDISIISNSSSYEYAGLYLSGDGNVLSRLKVLSNTARVEHAGIYVTGNRTWLDSLQVRHNRVLTTANCLGGGIYLDSDESTLQNSLVSDNWGCYGGGGYLRGGPYTFTNNLVTDNHASTAGGGLYLEDQGLVESCYIVGNQAGTGGGIYMSGIADGYTIANSFIADNQVSAVGGGLYADRNGALVNNTIANNQGQAVFYDASSSYGLSMINSIVASHTVGIESVGDGYVTNDYTLFHNNTDPTSGTVNNGFHNKPGDPAFVDPGQRDYHITQESEAINSGFTVPWLTDDYDGEPRPNGLYYDIGADESYEQPVEGAYFTYTPPEATFGQPLRFIGNVLTGTAPIDYAWDFGDGTGAEGRYPLHSYPAPGPYTVVMTASNVANSQQYRSVYSEVVNVVVRSVLLEPDWVTATAEGQTVHLWHTLTNTGNVSDSYSLEANSLQGWPVSSTTPMVPLLPGEETTIWVSVTVPWSSGGQVGQTIITATSAAAPAVYDTATDEIIVVTGNTQPGVAIAPDRSGSGFAGQTPVYQHVLTNTGNGPDYFQLQTHSSLTWTVALSPSKSLQLDSGQTGTLQLRVTIPAGASPNQTDVTTITATSLVSPAVSASVVDTSTVLEIAPDVRLEPDYSIVALESGPVHFTHTLTNTGNYSDSFVLTASSSQGWALDWTESPTGPLAAGQAKTVLLTVTVPDGAQGVIDYTVVTATSQIDDSVYDTATDEIVVPGEQRQAGVALSPGGSAAAYAGETLVYQHVLTNTGDGPDRFNLVAGSSQGWPQALSPSRLVLGSGQTATLQLSLTIPADAPAGQVDVTAITATSTVSPVVFASAVNTTTIVPIPRGVSLEPDHLVIANENEQLYFNHVLSNTGATTDSFDLDLSASESWPISWTPGPFGPLAVSEWALVRVTVTVPSGSAGQIDQIVLTATSQADGVTYDTATDMIAVLAENPQPGVTLVPNRSGSAWPGQVATYLHTLTNTGNGADYFRLEAVSSLGWTVVLTPSLGILLDSGESTMVRLSVVVPEDATAGQIDVTTLTATSLLAPTVSASVTDETRVRVETENWIYLPVVLKGN